MRIIISNLLVFYLLSMNPANAQEYFDWSGVNKVEDSVFIMAREFYKTYYKDNMYVGDQSNDIATINATYFYADYLQGNIYPSFLGYETYVKNVLKQVIKDEKLLKPLS